MALGWPHYLLAVNYAFVFFVFFFKGLAYMEQIGPVRHGLYYEDLHQMHWERCCLAALPHAAMWVLMLALPVLYYLPEVVTLLEPMRPQAGLLLDVGVWSIWLAAWFVVFLCGCALAGSVYYNVWRKADHVERYNDLKNRTLISSMAYGAAHWKRQIFLRRRKRVH